MERYFTRCERCGVQSRYDYKTGMGKTPEQLEAFRKRRETCPSCSGPAKELSYDEERAAGISPDPIYTAAAAVVKEHIIASGRVSTSPVPSNGPRNFLEQHYERYRLAGGDHAMYVVYNDLEKTDGDELAEWFAKAHPEGVQKKDAKLDEDTKLASALDDLAWLTGTGRFGQ